MNKETRKCANCNNEINKRCIEIADTADKMPFCDWNCVYDYVKNPNNFNK